MVAIVTLFSCSLLLITSEALGIASNYEILKKYNCWKNVDLFLDRAIMFSYGEMFLDSWPGFNSFDCQMTVSSRTKSTGIIAIIQALKFRKNKVDACIDYIKSSKDATQRCGDMLFGLHPLENGTLPSSTRFVSEYGGPFTVNNNWPESKLLLSPGAVVQPDKSLDIYTHIDGKAYQPGDNLEFKIAFTGFQECDGFNTPKGMFNCGYGVCILDIFVFDGVVNCPFGDCRDEISCEIVYNDFIEGNGTEELGMKRTSEGANTPNNQRRRALQVRNFKGEDMILGQVEHIGDEFEKHNGILEHISQFIEMGVSLMQKEKTKE